jgi:UTP--glucose-1-phosphate uridylyltransferase
MKVKKAVIPAAGLGIRFLPATKSMPKEMLPVVDKPVIQYVVEEAVTSGIEDIIIITGKNKRAIEDHFDRSFEIEEKLKHDQNSPYYRSIADLSKIPDILYVRQKEQKGLGDAILHAERYCARDPFVVLLGDTICISPPGERTCTQQMMEVFDHYRKSVIAVEKVSIDKIMDYGIIDAREINHNLYSIRDIVEKPSPQTAPSNLGAIGRYIFTEEIFSHIHEIKPGYGGEIQLTDAIRRLHEPIGLITNCRRYDIGDKLSWMKSSIELTLNREEFSSEIRKFLDELLYRY